MKKTLSVVIISLLCLSTFANILPQADARPTPGIELTTTSDKTNAQVGGMVTYTFKVTNTGTVTLFNVQVESNPAGPAIKQTESGRANDKLESGETWIFTATYTVTDTDPDPLVNTANATAYTRKGEPFSATDIHYMYLYGTEGDMLPDVLTSPNQEPSGGWYGCSVAIGEGVIVVGAAYESIPNPLYDPTLKRQTEPSQIYGSGRVYIYSATDGGLLTTLTSPNPTATGWFGYSVAVGAGVIVVGAPKETSGGSVASSGNAYVYAADTLDYIATLTSDNPVTNMDGQSYGVSVAVNDGIIAVGSSVETVNGIGKAGKVYIYNATTREPEFSPLISNDPTELGRFGWSVAVGEGVIVIGAPYEYIVEAGGYRGPAGRVYTYDTNGNYIANVTSPNEEFYGGFGSSVAVGDEVIVVGATGETVSGYADAGNVYIYQALNSEPVTLSSPTPQKPGRFGNSVAVDGKLIVVGALTETSGGYVYAGNAYVYDTAGGLQTTLTSLEPEEWGTFGWSVAVNAGVIVVGEYDAVYIFE